MRWLPLTAFVSALVLTGISTPAQAAVGFDSSYFGESAFLSLNPGQSGQFAAAFTNTGSTGWQVGTTSQVNLAVCLDDKTTCNVASPNAAWASGWLSSTAYATQSTTFVGPGQTGWFVYSVIAPAAAIRGAAARFSGDLVLNSTGEKLHAQGYYQDATVAGSTTTADSIVVTPVFQNAQIGSFPVLTATVTGPPPAGSSTRTPIANEVVVFTVSTTAAFNPPLSFVASTNALGQASITFTRTNPGTDAIAASLADMATLRTNATIVWGLTAGSISVTPDTAVSAANDGTGCRVYSYTATNPSTGALLNNAVLHLNFLENINHTTDQDGGATIAGDTTGSPTPTSSIATTTSATGTGTFTVCGNGSTVSVTPILFDNASNGDPQLLDTNDDADTGGTITFQGRQPVLSLSPSASGSRVTGDQRVFTITAADQFGTPYTGAVRASFQETQDGNPATSSTAYITWYDNDAILATGGASGPNAPAGTTDTTDTQNLLIPSLNSSGSATFGIYANTGGAGTAMVFVDTNGNGVFDAGEPSAVGGPTTWAVASLSQCTLTKSKPMATLSAGSANTSVLGNGAVFFVMTFRDQSGAAVSPSSPVPVLFSISNTGGGTIAARAEGQSSDTLLTSGSSMSLTTGYTISDSDAYLVVDSASVGSVSVSASATANGIPISCGPVALRWVNANPEPTTSTSLSGTVTDFDKGTSTTDGGAYVIHTVSGDYLISYSPGQPLILTGSSVTEAQFEAALSIGDVVLWSNSGGSESHNITANN